MSAANSPASHPAGAAAPIAHSSARFIAGYGAFGRATPLRRAAWSSGNELKTVDIRSSVPVNTAPLRSLPPRSRRRHPYREGCRRPSYTRRTRSANNGAGHQTYDLSWVATTALHDRPSSLALPLNTPTTLTGGPCRSRGPFGLLTSMNRRRGLEYQTSEHGDRTVVFTAGGNFHTPSRLRGPHRRSLSSACRRALRLQVDLAVQTRIRGRSGASSLPPVRRNIDDTRAERYAAVSACSTGNPLAERDHTRPRLGVTVAARGRPTSDAVQP